MTSPTWETFCCTFCDKHPSIDQLIHFQSTPFSITCIISATFGILGAFYQIIPVKEENLIQRRSLLSGQRQRTIIKLLASADLFACIGIIIRSIVWLSSGKDNGEPSANEGGSILCAFISGWILYFYTSSYMWTMCYAVDVFLTVKENIWKMRYYHLISWGLPFIIVLVELVILYVPDFKCHSSWIRVLVHYILTFLSLFTPMLVNPILYAIASYKDPDDVDCLWTKHVDVRILLQSHLGRYTDQERSLIRALQTKFFHIVVVFYVCWFPNILNSFILWICWGHLPRKFLIGLWYFIAILNPLQAVLNSLVYTSWRGCSDIRRCSHIFKTNIVTGIIPEESTDTERCEVGNERELLVNVT